MLHFSPIVVDPGAKQSLASITLHCATDGFTCYHSYPGDFQIIRHNYQYDKLI